MSTLAFVDTNGNVTLVLNTDPLLAPSFTQSAHIVDVSNLPSQPLVGWVYDGTNFSDPTNNVQLTPVNEISEGGE
jgi:hypothetical protein